MGIANEIQLATTPELARRMIERAAAAGVPFRWVVGDSVYGSESRIRSWLEDRATSYVLRVTGQYPVF